MPNKARKSGDKAVIEPARVIQERKKIGLHPSCPVPAGAIMCYDIAFWQWICADPGFVECDGWLKGAYLVPVNESWVLVLKVPGFGAPTAVMTLEELAAFRINKFVNIGTAGGLQQNMDIGDIVLCDRAIRDEADSVWFVEKEHPRQQHRQRRPEGEPAQEREEREPRIAHAHHGLLPLVAGVVINVYASQVAVKIFPYFKKIAGLTTLALLVFTVILYGKEFLNALGSFAVAALVLWILVIGLVSYAFGFGLNQAQRSALSLGVCSRNGGATLVAFTTFPTQDPNVLVMLLLGVPVPVIVWLFLARFFAFRAGETGLGNTI